MRLSEIKGAPKAPLPFMIAEVDTKL